MSEEEMKALVEMNNMLKHENTKLKQDNQELISTLRAISNQVKQYEVRGLLVHTITESLTKQIDDILEKLREFIANKTHFMTENGIQYMCNSYDLLQILNEGDK
jgi:regulator of replication initiation timing